MYYNVNLPSFKIYFIASDDVTQYTVYVIHGSVLVAFQKNFLDFSTDALYLGYKVYLPR